MRLIYENAEEVIVFLGDGRGHRLQRADLTNPPISPSSKFLGNHRDESFLASFLETCQTSNPRDLTSLASPALCAMCLVRLLSDESKMENFCRQVVKLKEATRRHLFECLRSFLICPWWKRIWVVQEIAVSRDAVVHFGNVSAPWKVLVGAASVTSSVRRESTALAELEFENFKVLELFQNQLLSLEETRRIWKADRGSNLGRLLQQFSDRQASDDRDKVYGLLSLAKQGHNIQPNYELDVQQTYINTFLSIIKSDVSLVCWAGDQKRKNRLGFPSWVPDWSNGLDVADRHRAAYADKYNVNRGWRLQIVYQEMDYWLSVKTQMKLLIDSLVRQQKQLSSSLYPAVVTYRSNLQSYVGRQFFRFPQIGADGSQYRKLWATAQRWRPPWEAVTSAREELVHECERLELFCSKCLPQHVALT